MIRKYFTIIICALFFFPIATRAATLTLSPSAGEFSVGSTFSVSVLLDTNGKSVNALALSISFPPDMLQIVSPSAGQSIIGVWTAAPRFDNQTGRIELQGGIPGGITASGGLVTTLTFRVKSVGPAVIKFLDSSKVLLNDGLGTNALTQTGNAIFEFKLPPPAGPLLASETNPDQATWYPNRSVSFRFEGTSDVTGYSYVLSDDPGTIPDDISEGASDRISYGNLTDGTHYFHIKGLRGGIWGGTTHYAVKIDGTPPADFKIQIAPDDHTSSRQPIIQFSSSDALSGVDYYDIKIVPLSYATANDDEIFFIESTSPYVPSGPLELGSYDVIVRAYDKAHNYKEIVQRLTITRPLFAIVSIEGIHLGGIVVSWVWVLSVGALLVAAAFFALRRARRIHRIVHENHEEKKLPEDIIKQLDELKRYRSKYGTKGLIVLLAMTSFLFSSAVHAAEIISPPIVTTLSKSVTNEQIFYVGGKTDFANEKVVLYVQNLNTGETFTETSTSNNKGDWFYRHSTFLSPGNYLIWTQAKLDENLSPPGPQVKMTVSRTAVQFGGSQISYETIYLILALSLLCVVLVLVGGALLYLHRAKKKRAILVEEIKEAEQSVKRGFAVLRRDIKAELALIKDVKISGPLSKEASAREAQLLSDLESVESKLSEEIWELEEEST